MTGGLRAVAPPFVVPGPAAVSIRTRLRVSSADAELLTEVGGFLGSLAGHDLAVRCRAAGPSGTAAWAARKRTLTEITSARWAGSITRATEDQWALARRNQAAEMAWLRTQIARIEARLTCPLPPVAGDRRTGALRGYATKAEWHAKSRRLATLRDRLAALRDDWEAGKVGVVRGGRRLMHVRHHLDGAGLDREQWARRWQAARMFLVADGESGKRWGNETIRVTGTGELSLRLPSRLAHLANAPHCRYVLDASVIFSHRAEEWQDRIAAHRAVAYRIHFDVPRGRWYLTASWKRAQKPAQPIELATARGVVAVDMNDDHLAAWQLDRHGNPLGGPRRYAYDLSGGGRHRDAQIRHALTRLLHHVRARGVTTIAVENLDFTDGKSREHHGRSRTFRALISQFPTAAFRARLVSMAAEQGVTVIAVDPAYTSRWGAQHWRGALTTPGRRITRHDAAAVAIGRRALGFSIRRRTAPPPHDRSDRAGHRTDQAGPETRRREGPRPRLPGPRTRSVSPAGGAKAGDQRAQHHSGHAAGLALGPQEDGCPLALTGIWVCGSGPGTM
ncbi:IS200/IS605 family accessory protein TnpB-related protein [Streptomyces sp. NPDC001651]|uniref:IS200/IS605 family accessory protein TnpB-related protein n=1 Tax=Streptomyces sp. NPDC001651 TaxID=3364596 RepID=UPI00368FEAAD